MKHHTYIKRTAIAATIASLVLTVAPVASGQEKPDSKEKNTPQPQPTATATVPEKKIPVETVKDDNSGAPAKDDDILVLSPFEVVTDNKGYYSSNTMSGTRFKTKLEDLGSSITVVNKDQMSDFGMIDINDVFNYVGNTEGTGTYTDYVIDRNGQAFDNVQLNPNNANRIRGISAANISYGNFEVSGRMAVDELITEGIEVSRGPNANVFGLGNAGGTVNQVPVSANLTRNKTRITLRGDSYDGWRTTFDTNVVLKKNVLAIRASGSYMDEEFQRKPSGMYTRRLNAMIKYSPFRYTTISGLVLDYNSHGNRPNFTPPRDNVSYWRANGSPGWNPNNSTVVINGVESGWNAALGRVVPMTTAGTVAFTNSNDTGVPVPDYFFRPNYMFQRSNIYIDQSGIGYWTAPVSTQGGTTGTPFTSTGTLRLQLSSPGYGIVGNNSGGRIGSQPLFSTVPVVSDKSLYDWSEVNLSAVNRLNYSTKMYLGQIDQIVLNTPTQNLTFQLAALREDNDSYERTPIGNSGNSGVSGQLFVDVNTRNLDGTINPYYGRPFIGVSEPRTVYKPATWDTYRGQFSYRLDLSKEQGALKWLGIHQLSGYSEYKYRLNRQYVYRDVMVSDHPWTASGQIGIDPRAARANQSNNTEGSIIAGQGLFRNFMRYYVGDANGYNVDNAPSEYAYGNYDYHYGSPVQLITTGPNAGQPNPATGFTSVNATLGRWATTDSTGGTANLKQVLKTNGIVLQSQFFNSKLVLNGGLREDKVYSKFGATPQLLVDGFSEHDWEADNHWARGDWRYSSGKTKTYGGVARPFRDLGFVTKASESSGFDRHWGQFLRGLAFTYNYSDTFYPQGPAIDLQLRQLPNITGEGKEYGVWINMLDNKLVVRVNHYDNKQLNARNGEANTIAQRVLRMDLNIPVSDNYQLHDVVERWLSQAPYNFSIGTPQMEAEIAKITKMDPARSQVLIDAFNSGTIAATNDIYAKGTEVEIYYNPTKYWTIAASAEKKSSANANISNSVQEWLDERLPVLQSIIDPRYVGNANGGQWWTTTYNSTRDFAANGTTAASNYDVFVKAPYQIIKEQDGKSLPSVREYSARISTSYKLAGITSQRILKNFTVGGAVRFESKGAIGYYGVMDNNGIYQKLDRNRPIYDGSHIYYDPWIKYRTKIWHDRIDATIQLNCQNIQEGGRLQPIATFPDGTASNYRIVDPRKYFLTVTLEL
ncbi:MAG: TonB-dependent receptor [Nibricoccus sp.]